MENNIDQVVTRHLIQGLKDNNLDEQYESDQDYQHYDDMDDNTADFQRYLEPNSQFLRSNFGNLDPSDLPGQYTSSVDGINSQEESFQRDLFGEEELIQIENNQVSHATGNSAAYQRSRPDGSPMFSQSTGFVAVDAESVVFRPIKQLDFSSLDETGTTDVILPRGMNRSASTPDHKNSKSISMITREQFIENSGMDRHESPDGNFYELKSSPNQSEQDEELDSKVIFSPLHGFQEEHFDTGMKSPPLSKVQNVRQNIPQNFNFGSHQNPAAKEKFELTQRPIDDTNISQFSNDEAPLDSQQNAIKNGPQRSVQPFGKEGRSPSHGPSPHRHSISPSLLHYQAVETREIFVSVPQHIQFGHSPDSLNQSGGESKKLMDFEMNQSQPQSSRNQQQYTSANGGQNLGQRNMQNISAQSTGNAVKYNENSGSRGQSMAMKGQAKEVIRPETSTNNSKPEGKAVDKRPWNYAKGSGNTESQSYLDKGAQKREVLAQHAKARMVREEPKGKVQEKTVSQPIKAKKDVKIGNGKSTENLNRVGEASTGNKNPRQAVQGQNRGGNIPVSKGSGGQDSRNKLSNIHVPVSRENKGETVKQTRDGREQHKDYSPVTQVEQYSDALDSSLDVQGMEDVRSQLKNMLKISSGESMLGAKSFDFNEGTEHINMDNFPGNVDYSLMSGNNQDSVSDLLENFPSITACMWTDNSSINRSDVSVHNENARLREMLEKERYRRKHCEQQIQKLNIKHLETQQQLAVAVSTDKRKDIMIEQLDKQLGKVLEGWKKQDHEKTVTLEKARQEKKKFEETLAKKQQVIDSFERDMAQALDVVRRERDEAETTAEELRSQIEDNERNRQHAEDMLETEKEKSSLMKQELDIVKDNRDQIDKKFQQLQDRMYQEQDSWFKREQELLKKIDEVSESNVKVVQQEKDKNEELSNRNKQMEEEIHEIQKIIKKMEMEHDAVQREKESLKVEIGIMEAKFESAQRTLEAELASQMEKEIADQMSDLQKRVEKADSELREKHYEHTKELNQRHKEDVEKHLASFHRQLKDKDDENRKQVQEYEEKLQEYRSEITSLQESKQKLEKQRTDILLKLQQMMQSQWNEALSLLATTPQRKRGSFNGPARLGASVSKTSSSSVEFSLPQDTGSALHMSDLANRDLSTSQRESNFNHNREELPVSAEVNLTDFQASLHMQQLLQSLSSFTTQPFPAYGTGPPVNHQEKEVFHDSNQTVPHTYRSDSSHEESRSASYPASPNPKQTHKSQMPYHHANAVQKSQLQSANYSQQQINFQPSDETDEFNNHLQMLLNANRPNPPLVIPREESVNYRHNTLNQSQSSGIRQPHRQKSNESVDHWLRQSQTAHDSHNLSQSHDLNISRASQQEDYISQMGMAVPIRPPQQHESFMSQPDAEHIPSLSSQNPDMSHISFHPPSACYSPPTKQTRKQASQHDPDPILNESVRLAKDYNEITDKVEQHEYRQGELQHYIHMLLQKPPGSVTDPDENASLFSHDQTEDLDLNDTAQAAQIQRELSRIQELRNKPHVHDETDRQAVKVATGQGSKAVGQSFQGVLQPEHLAEISRYLEKHKDHLSGKTEEDEHLAEIVGLLRNMQQNSQRPGDSRGTFSPKSPRDKAKKNAKGQIAKVADSAQSKPETNQGQSSKSQGQPKKVERKVASVGPNRHIPGKGKNAAWK